jgi:hypothetical protein
MTEYDKIMAVIFIPLLIFFVIVTANDDYRNPFNSRTRREDD